MRVTANTTKRYVKQNVLTDLMYPILDETCSLVSGTIVVRTGEQVSILVRTLPVKLNGEQLLELQLSEFDMDQIVSAITAARSATTRAGDV